MGVTGHYLRLSDDELAELAIISQDDPGETSDYLYSLPEPTDGWPRQLDLDKTWDALQFLWRRSGLPHSPFSGESDIRYELGNGIPLYLDPVRVTNCAKVLDQLTFVSLLGTTTSDDMRAAQLYQAGIDWSELRGYLESRFRDVAPYMAAAARTGQHVLLEIA